MKTNVLTASILFALVGCGGGSTSQPVVATPETTTPTSGGETTTGVVATPTDPAAWQASVTAGADSFDHKCSTCHGEGGTGDGAPDLRNIHFTPERMRTQIREGSGRMRPISVERLPDADMENVVAWLTTIGAVDMAHP